MDQGPIRDEIVKGAATFDNLVHTADALDPSLASKLRGGATLASATPVGSALGFLAGTLLAHYGITHDPDLQKIVVGGLVMAGGYAAHWIQQRITNIAPSKK